MIDIARETLVLRREGILPSLSLLIPTFAFPDAPEYLAVRLRRRLECSPTDHINDPTASVDNLIPDYYPRPTPRLVSCYALFK